MSIDCGHFQIVDSCEHCQKIQRQWYAKLKKKGFQDAEDSVLRLLKRWTGISDTIEDENNEKPLNIIDMVSSQDPNESIKSNWPEISFAKEDEILNSPKLQSICETLFKHGNNAVSPKQMILIWELHCEGLSIREIGKHVNIYFVSVFRAIKKLKEMADLMDLTEDPKKIILRNYDEETDAPLIFASWRNALWFDLHPNEEKPNPVFYRMMTKKINMMLRNPNTKVKIACLADDHNEIKGYSVLCGTTLEMIYVKLDYRNQGVATLLCRGFKTIAKPLTKIARAIADKKNLKENQDGREETENQSQRI